METLTSRIVVTPQASLQKSATLHSPSCSLSMSPLVVSLASGSVAGCANQYYDDERTIASGGSDTVNIVTFNGTADGVGGTLNLAAVKALIVANLDGTEANKIVLGNSGVGAWTAPFNGSSSASVSLPGGASLCIMS